MTVQIPDRIILEETAHPLFCEPPIFESEHDLECLSAWVIPNTALRRGYVATWAIRDGILYLEGLKSTIWLPQALRERLGYPSRGADEAMPVGLLETHGTMDPVPTEWISQDLYIGYGQFEPHRGLGYGAIPAHFRVITVGKGRVINDRVMENIRRSCRMPDVTPTQPEPKPSWLKRLLAPSR